MRKENAFKAIMLGACAALFISLPGAVAHAESVKIGEGIAGIAKSLNNVDKKNQDIVTQIYNDKIISPLEDKGVSKATNYVNIRSSASTESEVVGKLYRGCAVNILERLPGDWVKIKSGDVEGYIASQFLATGKEAEKMADEYATKYATVINTQTLRVREKASTDARTLELIPLGETYIVTKEYDEWAEIIIGSDDSDGEDITGFVHKDYIKIDIEFKEAISIEEENRILREQEEAKRAEAERLRKLAAEEEAKRKEEAARKKAAEEAAKQAAAAKANSKNQSESKQTTKEEPVKETVKESGNAASVRNEIVSYAKKFVGNPYVWGGTSLTGGADCSGFVWRIYKDFGYSLNRTSAEQAQTAGVRVDVSDRKPGDLIFYGTNSGHVNHVAIYIGGDKIVHAANSRQGIIISAYNYRKILKVRRVVQ